MFGITDLSNIKAAAIRHGHSQVKAGIVQYYLDTISREKKMLESLKRYARFINHGFTRLQVQVLAP